MERLNTSQSQGSNAGVNLVVEPSLVGSALVPRVVLVARASRAHPLGLPGCLAPGVCDGVDGVVAEDEATSKLDCGNVSRKIRGRWRPYR